MKQVKHQLGSIVPVYLPRVSAQKLEAGQCSCSVLRMSMNLSSNFHMLLYYQLCLSHRRYVNTCAVTLCYRSRRAHLLLCDSCDESEWLHDGSLLLIWHTYQVKAHVIYQAYIYKAQHCLDRIVFRKRNIIRNLIWPNK